MKNLPIKNLLYQKYLISFKEWLTTLGYSEANCKGLPYRLREFFHYLEQQGIKQFTDITSEHTHNYIEYFKTRKHTRSEGGLSIAYINSNIAVLLRFAFYLRSSAGIELPSPPDYLKGKIIPERDILSEEEIKNLYAATDESPYGIRDRAVLTVYYGCGLRKKEGVNLDASDVLLERRLLHVSKAKNGHERYVPITGSGLRYLESYMTQARPLLLPDESTLQGTSNESALFVNSQGERLCHNTMYNRLKALYKEAGITKNAGIHTLRHSIATHLLQKGLELEQIALFLGHRSLDSTQIYTHIVNEVQQTL